MMKQNQLLKKNKGEEQNSIIEKDEKEGLIKSKFESINI